MARYIVAIGSWYEANRPKDPSSSTTRRRRRKKQWGLKKLSRWYCLFSPSLSRLWSDLVIDTHHMLTVPHPKHRERDTCLESLKGQYEVNIVSLALYLRYYYYWRYIHSVRNSNSFPFHKFILFPPFFFGGGGWRMTDFLILTIPIRYAPLVLYPVHSDNKTKHRPFSGNRWKWNRHCVCVCVCNDRQKNCIKKWENSLHNSLGFLKNTTMWASGWRRGWLPDKRYWRRDIQSDSWISNRISPNRDQENPIRRIGW